jgi:hypothetical protein
MFGFLPMSIRGLQVEGREADVIEANLSHTTNYRISCLLLSVVRAAKDHCQVLPGRSTNTREPTRLIN